MMAEQTRERASAYTSGWSNRVYVGMGIDMTLARINYFTSPGSNALAQWGAPGSTHTGGCHGLLADGTVRFLSENMDLNIQNRLFYQADGNTIGEF
jgi:hypothetical protein